MPEAVPSFAISSPKTIPAVEIKKIVKTNKINAFFIITSLSTFDGWGKLKVDALELPTGNNNSYQEPNRHNLRGVSIESTLAAKVKNR